MNQLIKINLSQYLDKSNIYKLLHINIILIFRLTKNNKKIKLINDYIVSSTIGKYMNDIGIKARNNFDYKKAFDSWLFGMKLGYMNCYTLYLFNQTMLYIDMIDYDLKLEPEELYHLININSNKHPDILSLLGSLYLHGIGIDMNEKIGKELIKNSIKQQSLYGMYFLNFNNFYNEKIYEIIPSAILFIDIKELTKLQQQKIYEKAFNNGYIFSCFLLARHLMNIKDYDKIRIKEILEIGSSFGCGLCSSFLKKIV